MNMETLKFRNYYVEIEERENPKTFPKHAYKATYYKETPKGKYSKVKILSCFVYISKQEAELSAQKWIENRKISYERNEAEKIKKREQNKAAHAFDFFKIGDVVCNTWGWEQTNVEFYQVTDIKPKTITVKRISSKVVEGSVLSHGMACDLVPDIGVFTTERGYNLRVKDRGKLSNPERYYYFRKWDGRPQYSSWYA